MTSAILLLAVLPAFAGYGDVNEEEKPSWIERDVHIWTNAVRVDPSAFEEDYNTGGCSFDSFLPAEQGPLPPLSYDPNLNDSARFHSTDMSDNNWFAHESSDGTPFGTRISRFYDSGFAGENIAQGYPSGPVVVLQGWMCSDGHRANIMTDGYQELGVGVVGTYYTQNFGGGERNNSGGVGMGNHSPGDANHEATFYADYYASDAPASFAVVVNGDPIDMVLEWGVDNQGVYLAEFVPDEPTDCYQYYFMWESPAGEQGIFPEEGSYTYGESCDDALGWVPGHLEVSGGGNGNGGGGGGNGANGLDKDGTPLTAGTPKLVGCSSIDGTPSSAGWLLVGLLALPALGRRRD